MGEIREVVRANIERAISSSPFTQKEIAERIGVSTSAVSNWIKGRNSPDIEALAKLCELLEIPLHDIYASEVKDTNSSKQDQKAPLDAFAKAYNLNRSDRVLVEKWVALSPKERRAIVSFMEDVVFTINGETRNNK